MIHGHHRILYSQTKSFYSLLNTTPTLFSIIRIPANMKLSSNIFSISFKAIVAVCFVAFLMNSDGSSSAQAQVSFVAFERFRCASKSSTPSQTETRAAAAAAAVVYTWKHSRDLCTLSFPFFIFLGAHLFRCRCGEL